MNKTEKTALPQLRFRQFIDCPAWSIDNFGNVSVPVEARAGTKKYTLMSVTAGIGLIPQIEKFGREIAGSAYKNYYVIKKHDFAYNKSATKQFPEGYISMLTEYEEAALPNSIFTCFRIADKEFDPRFFNYLFHSNYHGSWLRKYIEVGARAHGSLSVDTQHLWEMPIALPKLEEQQKIADCLSSLDELITAEDRKLEALKAHKKGLMQKLFPTEGETVPEWRFPEFRDSEEWKEYSFGKLIRVFSGKGFMANEYAETGIRLLQIENVGYGVAKWNGDTIYLPQDYIDDYPELVLREGDVVLALNRPVTNNELKIALLSKDDEPSLLYQRVGKLQLLSEVLVSSFAFHTSRHFIKNYVEKQSIGSDQPFISVIDLYSQQIMIPSHAEQQRIADCLSPLDDIITAQSKKIEDLKTHKKGLIQKLFPSIEEVGK